MTVSKLLAVGSAAFLLSGPSLAETFTDYESLISSDGYRIIDQSILDDGSVVILISARNKNHVGFICQLHRDPAKSFNDECREIGD